MSKKHSLILGMGEVGKSLFDVLSKNYEVSGYNETEAYVSGETFQYLHICFPYSKTFVQDVLDYKAKFKPKFTVIHSTVPVGISRKCGAIHSPIVGIHPHLAESITTFTKYLSGKDASGMANYFRKAGIKVYLFDKQETTEIGKLSQTTFYALTIEYVKELQRICYGYGLSFTEVYTTLVQDYNRGYEQLGYPEIKIPLLVPIMTPQGGHCTIPNCGLWNNDITKFVERMNKK
jgi:hypothetical protein